MHRGLFAIIAAAVLSAALATVVVAQVRQLPNPVRTGYELYRLSVEDETACIYAFGNGQSVAVMMPLKVETKQPCPELQVQR